MKITIVTITYNAAKVLQPTLDSVRRQTYPQVEHLIVDGASQDETLDIARKYKAENDAALGSHEVTITSKPDRGIYDAMNKGLDLATGQYILFLNAGDCLPEADTLEHVARLCAADVAVVYGDTDIIDGDGHITGHRHLQTPKRLSWRSFRQGMVVCHQAFYARTDIAREERYNLAYRHSADVDWCIRVMRRAENQRQRLVNADRVVALFLNGGDSQKNHKASLRERYLVMCSHYGTTVTIVMHCWFAVRALMRKL